MRCDWRISVILVLWLLAGCAGKQDTVSAGREVFETGGNSQIRCSACHTLDGSRLVGPSLLGMGDIADQRAPGQAAEQYLYESIVDPAAYLVEGYENTMPGNFRDTLSEDEISAVIAFLLTQ
jgi:mono/diheme cytochrome c family protein